ncbi:MAG: phosphate ABC transporter permease subunit PstC [Chloroflexi bacterium]|nr:MAG: phosphate ABC transporter permease subunit PstC [Anaerolineaceae bacterium 4572_32.2]RLC80715.1 MAG: phosphate ABC transporter permease subunit PstC [Chloroflexota bacterium]RLC81310.1 MAG: phosphate ABC transporter permease subunit PstC [Chloroflexota bacterium]HEY74421.1 phosphate ABC transporter permease subunit PstC [Thermoflexia bacterium]
MKNSFYETLIERLIRVTGVLVILFLALIFLFLLREGGATFFEASLRDLLRTRWYPNEEQFGLLPLVLGSLMVTLGAAVVSLPLGLLTAVFIAEVAPRWVREILKPFIEVLAGIPSVVLGFLGMLVISPLIREHLGAPTGLTALSGSVMLGYMALPTIISVAEDALDAVPKSYRDAALALGATRWQTIWRVTVPAARSGILTAMMLGIGRAIGETMAVMMVTGNAARMPLTLNSFLMPVRTMTATIAAEMGEVAQGSTHYHVLFAIGLVLFLVTFLINLIAAWTIFRQGKRYGRLLS